MSEMDDLVDFLENLDTEIEDGCEEQPSGAPPAPAEVDVDASTGEAEEHDDDDEEEEELYLFECTGCQQNLAVDEEALGTELECPSCGKKLVMPGRPRVN